jgi:hypothetical protein
LNVTAAGTGAAAAYDYSNGNTLVTQTNAANPGDYLILWGSGLGPAAGDETVFQTPVNLSGIPIEVDIGGVSATVTYHGRSAYPGLDQINVQVPAGVTGCAVSLVVTAGGLPSNYATIAVAASGRTCSDPLTSAFSTTDLDSLSGLSTINLGLLSLGESTNSTLGQTILGVTLPGQTTTTDFAGGFFESYTGAQFTANGFAQIASIGSCLVTTFTGQAASTSPVIATTPLDAGPQINLSGPDGNLALLQQNGFYFPSGTPAIIPAGGGDFTFNNGAGGKDVGAFSTSLSVAQTTPIVWTNSSSITSVTRSQGVTFQWTGGIAGTYVEMTGSSITLDLSQNYLGASFVCTAPVGQGQFTVPASVLDSLPASGTLDGFNIPGTLGIANYTVPQKFSATGLNLGAVIFYVSSSTEVPFI